MNLRYPLLLIFFCCIAILSAQDTTIIYTLNIPIQSGIDDVEELSTGEISAYSTDLELIYDQNSGEEQTVGMHFENVPLVQGADIAQAYIQFRTDETSNSNCNLQIHGEVADDAPSFSTTFFDLTNRPFTIATVDWSPAPWLIPDASTEAQSSPDITTILQEIINQPNWIPGNAINLFIDGTGRRVAHAFEGNPDFVAQLIIEVNTTVLNGDLSNIFINELMASNNVVADEYGETDDWVELYNANDNAVLLEGLFLSDDVNDKTKWQIEGPVIIPANGFTLFWLDDAPEQGDHHAPFKLSSSGETIFLSQMQSGNLVVIDEVEFSDMPKNISYGRETDGDIPLVYFGEYSPGFSNDGNGLYLNASLDFSIASGFYESGTELSISTDNSDVDIRITTNGSIPTEASTLYSNPLVLSQTTQIRAAAFKPGYSSGSIKEAFYLINNNHELPVIQISIDPKYLWDNQEGMYVTGINGIPGFCSDSPQNWNQDWERPASLRYFEPDGAEGFQVNAGMKIGGGCSRAFPMKGFNFFLRGDEYGDDKVEYPLFKELGIDEFKRFKLRASGNDFPLTMIRDGALQSMLYNQVDIDLMAYEPAVVYLNGQYWGFYGVREFFNKHYLESHHGVNKDSLDLMKNPYINPDIKEGDLVAWDELTYFIRNNTLTIQSNYSNVANKIDINEYINYNITQIYLANYDWPANNVAVWRHRNNGKWRWMLFDLDISSGFGQWSPAEADFNAINHATTTTGQSWPNGEPSTLFLRKLLANPAFRQEFTQRTCTFAQVIFAPDRSEHFIDSLSATIASEIPRLTNKFNNAPANWQLWQSEPVGGSPGSWQNHLNVFKNFFEDRFPFVRSHYQNHFNLSGHFNLTLNFDENSGGTIVLHKNDMKVPFQYNGIYFDNIPIRIKAIAKPEYQFIRWKETGDTSAVIYFQAIDDSILTPVFLKDGEEEEEEEEGENPPATDPQSVFDVFPIPAQTELLITYSELQTTPFSIRIFNALGQLIYSEQLIAETSIQEHSIDVRRWAAGVYFLETKIGEVEILEKLMVK